MATVDAAVLRTRFETVGARQTLGTLDRVGNAVDVLKGNIAAGFAFSAGFAAFNAGLAAIKAGFDTVVGSASQFSASMEQSQIAFETMLGSAGQARAFLGELAQFARSTPFELPGLTQASQRLLAMGFNAREIVPLMRNIGNAAAGLNAGQEGIDRMVRALGQMRGMTRVTAEDMNQLTDVGVPAWRVLAESIGRTQAETRKLVEQGLVPAETFIAAFQRFSEVRFGDMMERQSRTMIGALSNIKDLIAQLGSTAFQPLFEWVRDLAVRFADFLQSDRAARWAAAVQAAARMVVEALTGLWQAAQPVLSGIGGLFDRFADLMGIPKAQAAAQTAGQQVGQALGQGIAGGISAGNATDAAIKALQGPLGHARIAAQDIKDAYTAAIDPLKEQAAALAPIVDFQTQIRDLQLDTEASAIREAQQRERLLDSAKTVITASGRIRRGKNIGDDLRLLDIEAEQRRTKAQQQWAEIQRNIALAPIQAQIDALEKAQKAHLAPIEAQVKAQERQVALLQIAKQEAEALAGVATTAAQNVAAAVGMGKGDRDQWWNDSKQQGIDLEKIKQRGKEIAGAFVAGLKEWWDENFKPGEWLTGAWNSPAVQSTLTRLKESVTFAFSPDGFKAWEQWRSEFAGAIDRNLEQLKPSITAVSNTIAKTLLDNAPTISRGFLFALKEGALITIKATTWLQELGVAIGYGVGHAIGVYLREHWPDILRSALVPSVVPGIGFPLPGLPAPPMITPTTPGAAETPINVQIGQIVLKPEMTDAERQEAEKRIGEDVMKQILDAQQAAA